MIIPIIVIVILAIVLVTVYEVLKNMRKGDTLNLRATNSFYRLPRRKRDEITFDIRNDEQISSQNSCSYSFWVRPEIDAFNGDSGVYHIFYRGKSETDFDLKVTIGGHGGLTVQFKSGSGSDYESVQTYEAIDIRSWTHVGLCLDNMNKYIEIYINGTLIQTQPANNIVIGKEGVVINPDDKEGRIQNLKYFNDVVSSKQMASLYKGQKMFMSIHKVSKQTGAKAVMASGCDVVNRNTSAVKRIRRAIADNELRNSEVKSMVDDIFKPCVADYGADEDTDGKPLTDEYKNNYTCGEDFPKCVGYQPGKMMGLCDESK